MKRGITNHMEHHLTQDLSDPEGAPYFLWSEDMSTQDFTALIRGEKGPYLQHLYMGRLMREARIADVWKFLDLKEISSHWSAIAPHLGRRRQFWEYLLQVWRAHGLM
jgi:hypothetical protein